MYNIKGNIPDLRQLRSRQGKFSRGGRRCLRYAVLNKWTELFAAFGTWQYIIAAAAAFVFPADEGFYRNNI